MKNFGKINHGPIPQVQTSAAKAASEIRLADGSSDPSVPVPDAHADAIDVDSDVEAASSTDSDDSLGTATGDAVEPPPPDEEWGDGKPHPCRNCKNMTLGDWGPALGTFCDRTCHDEWHAALT